VTQYAEFYVDDPESGELVLIYRTECEPFTNILPDAESKDGAELFSIIDGKPISWHEDI